MIGSHTRHERSVPRLTFHVALEGSRLLRARERIRDFLRMHCDDARAIDEVVLCVEEACTNAIRHSGADDGLLISMGFAARDLIVRVKDRGRGFDVSTFDRRVTPDPLKTGGRGLYLMANLMDELELRADDGLDVRMVKRGVLSRGTRPQVDPALAERLDETRASRIRAMLEEIDEAFVAFDWSYRIVHANRAALRLMDVSAEESLGMTLRKSPLGAAKTLVDACEEAMELGLPAVLEYQRDADGRWFEARVYPTSAGVSVYQRDIDARKLRESERDKYLSALRRSEARHRALSADLQERTNELSERVRLAESLQAVDQAARSKRGIDQVMARALQEGVGALGAQAAVIDMREAGSWFVRYLRGLTPEVLGMRLSDRQAPVATRARALGDVVAVPDCEADPLVNIGFIQEHAIKAVVAAPLIARGDTIGCLLFYYDRPHQFDQAQLDFVRKLGSSLSLALENDRLYGREGESRRLAAASGDGKLIRVIGRWRRRPTHVLLAVITLELAYLSAIASIERADRTFGLTGSLVTLSVIIAGALGGPLVGMVAAAGGGGLFYVLVAGPGTHSTPVTTAMAVATWLVAAVLAGLLADTVRTQTEKRRSMSVALARTVAAREAQMAEQRRVEALASDLHTEREQLLTMIEQADYGIVFLDRDFNVMLVNSNYARTCGHSPQAMVALKESVFRQVRDSGQPVEFVAEPLEFPDQPDRGVTYWDWRLAATRDQDGQVDGIVFSLVDVTARVRRQQLSEALNEIGHVVSAGLQPDRAMHTALDLTGRALGCSAGALVVRSGSHWLVTHVWDLPWELTGLRLSSSQLRCAELAVAEQRPMLDTDDCRSEPGEEAFSRRVLEIDCAIPLEISGEPVGALVFSTGAGARRRGEPERDFAVKAGGIISQALENARLFREQQRIATSLQENLLHPLPVVSGLEFGRVSLPAKEPELVGGDFSDVFVLDDVHVAVLIGDVAGKGIKAAGLTETVHTAVTSFALLDPSPDYVLRKTNDLLLQRADEQLVTAFLAIVNVRTGETSFARAGHPAPVLLGPTSCGLLDVPSGMPLGSFAGDYPVARTVLQSGECLVLYTDGVTEARRRGELFGERRLIEALAGLSGADAQTVAQRLCDAATLFAGRLRDDLQILTVRIAGPLHDQPLRLQY